MKNVRCIGRIAGVLLASAAMLPPLCVVGSLDRKGNLGWLLTRMWAWAVLTTGGVESLHSSGTAQLEAKGPAVVMSNHESFLDPVVIMALSRSPLRFMARHTLFYLPLFGWAMWVNGHVPVRRGTAAGAQRSLRRASKLLADGRKVVIYPEGTRADSEHMLPFKRGGVLLAIRNGTPIIPVGIAGTRSVCPKGWHWPEQHPVAAVAGQPIDTSAYRSSDASILVDLIRSRILELRTEAVGLISQCESDTLIDTEHLEEQRQFAGSSRLN